MSVILNIPRLLRVRSLCSQPTSCRPFSATAARAPLNIVLVGAPGVGKGTYAKHMAPYLNITHISTGDLVRDLARQENNPYKRILKEGGLVPDHEITSLLQKRLRDPKLSSGVLLDGYPRNLEQVELLDRFMSVTGVLHITLREDVLIQKCVARRLCPCCGENYNIANIVEGDMFMPALAPKRDGFCDKCDTKLVQREDDVEATVRSRLSLYKKVTYPIVKKYESRGILMNFELTSGVADMLPKFLQLCDKRWGHLANKASIPLPHDSASSCSGSSEKLSQNERYSSYKMETICV